MGLTSTSGASCLPETFVVQLMMQNNRDMNTAYSILVYGIEAGIRGDKAEHLFTEFFRACEVHPDTAAAMQVAEIQYLNLLSLKLPVKQITLGRLMAVCFSARDGEAADRVRGYAEVQGVEFSPHFVTKYVGTFLRLADCLRVNQVLWACENIPAYSKLSRESYQRLREVQTSPECKELLREHMQRVGMISRSSASQGLSDVNPSALHAALIGEPFRAAR